MIDRPWFRCLILPALLLSAGTAIAQRYTPPALCSISSNNGYESITTPIAIGGDYASGSVQSITIVVGDTQQPGGSQAGDGDVENVVILLDTNADGTPEVLASTSCNFSTSASPVGCTTVQNITVPTVTEDTSFRGRVMLSYSNTTPANGCGDNSYGDSRDFILTANVQESITLADASAPEDGGPITVTATASHDVRDASGFVAYTVDFDITDVTATLADADYLAGSGTLTFSGQAGEALTVAVNPVADTTRESDESVQVSLSTISIPAYGIDISDTATVTFTNDDEYVDLMITKQVDDDSPRIGDSVLFTLTVENNGPDAAVAATVQDSLPDGLASITPVTVPPGTLMTVSGTTLEWTGLNIAVGDNISATYSAVVQQP